MKTISQVHTMTFGNCQAQIHYNGNVVLKTNKGNVQLDATPEQLRSLASFLDGLQFQMQLSRKLQTPSS